MWTAAVLLCLAVGVHGQATGAEPQPEVQNKNAYLDEMIPKFNVNLNQWGMGMRLIPRKNTIGGVIVNNGFLIGLDSLHRTKDATEVKGATKGYFDVSLGARSLNLGYGQIITPEGKRMSGVFRSRGNSFRMKVLMDYPKACTVNVTHYEFETLGEVMMVSSDPEYDGKNVTEFFAKEVLPALNSWSQENIPFIENLLKFLCEYWKLLEDPPLVTCPLRLINLYLFQRD